MDFEDCKTIGDLIEALKAKYDLDHKINEIIQGDSDIMGLHLNIAFNNDGELANDFWGCMDCLCDPCECKEHYAIFGVDEFSEQLHCKVGTSEEVSDFLFHRENYDGRLYPQDVKDCPYCNPSVPFPSWDSPDYDLAMQGIENFEPSRPTSSDK